MYIRNAQGQLMWIPPKGYTPPPRPTQPTLEMLQQNMRDQIQRDEWDRFNAPPAQDTVYFHDQFSLFEGSTVNGYHSVAPPCNSPTMANHGNMMLQGQQHPYNRMNPPIPQVINPGPILTSPRNPTKANVGPASVPMFTSPRNHPQRNVGPASFRNAENSSSVPMFTSPRNPTQRNVGPASFRNPENSSSVPMFTSPRNPPQRNVGPASFRNTENSSSLPRFTSPRNPTRTNLGPASFRNPENSSSVPMFTGPRNPAQTNNAAPATYGIPDKSPSSMSMRPGNPPQARVGPPSFRNPENSSSVAMFTSPRNPAETNLSPVPSGDSEDTPPYNEIKLVKEEFVPEPKTGCMGAIFGPSFDLYRSNHRSTKSGLMNCDALNISTTTSTDDEDDFGGDSLSYFSHSQKHGGVFQCNGIRGPGKKFDYFDERRDDSFDSERDSKLIESVNDSIDAFKMHAMKITEEKPGCQEKRKQVTSPRSYCDDSDDSAVVSVCRETLGTYETVDAVVEDDSIEDRSGMIDHGSMTTEYAPHGRNEKERNDSSDSRKFTEFVKRVEKPPPIYPDADYSLKEINTPNNAEHRRTVKIFDEDSNENDKNLADGVDAQDYPRYRTPIVIREDFPSFDEPDFPSFDEPANYPTNGGSKANQSKKECLMTENDSDGENNQTNANICPTVEKKISISKQGTLTIAKETNTEMPLGNSSVINYHDEA